MPDADELVANALAAVRGTDVRQAERQLDQLMVGTGAADGTTAVDAALLRRLVRALGRLWPRGWQPVDVDRLTSRRLDPARRGWSARRWPPNGVSRPNRSRHGGTTSYAS